MIYIINRCNIYIKYNLINVYILKILIYYGKMLNKDQNLEDE